VNALGSISQMYMFILLALLFMGSGFAVWGFVNFLMTRTTPKKGVIKKSKVIAPTIVLEKATTNNIKNLNGGYFMNNNGWIKLAVFSFVGIIVSVIVLGFVSTNGTGGATNHQQQQGAQVQGGMNVATPMGNMQVQGNMNGATNDQVMMQQQLNQMQQQLSQMQQQQMSNMQGNMPAQNNMSSMPAQNNMSSMPQDTSNAGMMMDSMMNKMDSMMNMMNNMNNMQQQNSNMTNMAPSNGGGSNSGGSMSMPMM